jgi:amino-acid N-acetyltransferase
VTPIAIDYRKATERDWPAIAALLRTSALPLEGAQAHLVDFIVATSDNTLLGCIGIERHGSTALLRSCAVSAEARQRGLGTTLVERAIKRARTAGMNEIVLLTTTAESFFAALGFATIPRALVADRLSASEELRSACPASATTMRLDLTA